MRSGWLLGWCVVLQVSACSPKSELDPKPGAFEPLNVTGSWCGADVSSPQHCVGDEVEYLELTQQGSTVTGQICEAYDTDCAPIEDGKLAGTKLTFGFDPEDVGGLASLELAGDVLEGTLHSAKCDCDLPFTFHRL